VSTVLCCVRPAAKAVAVAAAALRTHLYASTATSTCCSAMTLSRSDSGKMGSPSGYRGPASSGGYLAASMWGICHLTQCV
jgi:hypothetical protein